MPDQQSTTAILWFRRDLRLTDNPALDAALATGKTLVLVYLFEDTRTDLARPLGGASKWWLDKSLKQLSRDIKALGGELVLRQGRSEEAIPRLIEEAQATHVFWNRRYEQPAQDRDAALKKSLQSMSVEVQSFNGSLLTEPWSQKTGSGGYYKVFTPYWRSVEKNYSPQPASAKPKRLTTRTLHSDDLDSFNLHPEQPDWSRGFKPCWQPGEAGAHKRLEAFLNAPVSHYIDQRNRPDIETGTSGLSPHLAFGEIGPAQIWRAVNNRIQSGQAEEKNATVFLKEIVWREFSYALLYHNQNLATENYNQKFAHMPWRDNTEDYENWCKGQTGFPMVDAGMRQLWQTGWMHNRVRMIVASFLTKHLLLPWQIGEKWFWDTLVDADPASNAASWQWTAGSGADAAPYFRVFNPITQGPKFDETGDYVRKYCPELAGLATKYIHRPWEASPVELAAANVKLGETYPLPIIDHKEGRERALAAYQNVKSAQAG